MEDQSTKIQLRPMIAEGIAMFFFCFFGGLAGILLDSATAICLAQALCLMIMILWCCDISGAHINPAVTLGFYLTKRIDLNKCLLYIMGQIGGSLLAGFVLQMVAIDRDLFNEKHLGMPTITIPKMLEGVPQVYTYAFICEMLGTLLLLVVILEIAENLKMGGNYIAIGVFSSISLGAFAFGGFTGGSFNPGRSFGPAFFNMTPFGEGHWIYYVAPTLGGYLGCLIFDSYIKVDHSPKKALEEPLADKVKRKDPFLEEESEIGN